MRLRAVLAAATLLAALVIACGTPVPATGGGDGQPIAAGPEESKSWPPFGVIVTREQAIATAFENCLGSAPEVTPVSGPHSPVARLMTLGEYETRSGATHSSADWSTPAWVIQYEGESQSAGIAAGPGIEPNRFRYAGCVIDAYSGEVTSSFRRTTEPLILPQEFVELLPGDTPTYEYESVVPAIGETIFTYRQALAAAQEHFANRDDFRVGIADAGRVELVLVSFTGPAPRTGPDPTPTPPPPGVTPEPTRVRVVPTQVVDRLAWLAVAPGNTELGDCGIVLYGRGWGDIRPYWWAALSYVFLDARTGETFGADAGCIRGPSTTKDELAALHRFAWEEGWWELWHQVRQFNGEPLPEGLAASLDRPNAPTPVPPTPTPVPTIDPNAPPTPTPTPTPPPTPTWTPPPSQ